MSEISDIKELARALASELSEYYLRIEGDDYRQLYVERNVNLEALAELERQLAETNARVAKLEATIDQLIAAGSSTHRSLCAFLDYAGEAYAYKCYNPYSAIEAWEMIIADWKEREK